MVGAQPHAMRGLGPPSTFPTNSTSCRSKLGLVGRVCAAAPALRPRPHAVGSGPGVGRALTRRLSSEKGSAGDVAWWCAPVVRPLYNYFGSLLPVPPSSPPGYHKSWTSGDGEVARERYRSLVVLVAAASISCGKGLWVFMVPAGRGQLGSMEDLISRTTVSRLVDPK